MSPAFLSRDVCSMELLPSSLPQFQLQRCDDDENSMEQTSLLKKAGDICYPNFKYSDEMTQRVKHLTPSFTSVKSVVRGKYKCRT